MNTHPIRFSWSTLVIFVFLAAATVLGILVPVWHDRGAPRSAVATQTYESQYGFSFEYPKNWSLSEQGGTVIADSDYRIEVRPIIESHDIDIDSFARFASIYQDSQSANTTSSLSYVNQYSVARVIEQDREWHRVITHYRLSANTVLTLEGFTRESVQPLLKVMDSVRNTEMTDRAMEGRHSTSGWTTYVNEGSQYAFRYPDGGIVSQSESRSDDCITLSASEWTMTVNANALYDTSCGDRYSSGSEQTATPLILQADHRHMAGYQISVRPFEEEEKVHYASFRHAVDDDRTMLFVLEGTGSSVAEKNANFDRHQAEMFAVLETFVNLRTWSTYSDPAYPVTFQVPSGWQVKPAKNTAAMPGLETPFSELAFTEIAREQGPFGNSTCSLALFHRGLDTLAQLVETRIPGISETYPNREVNQRMQYGNEVYSVEYANGMRTDLKSAALLRAGDAIVGFFRSDNPVGTILYNPPDHLNNCAIIEATLKVK